MNTTNPNIARACDRTGEECTMPREVVQSGWMPIETAPTNVQVVALFRGVFPVIAYKNPESDSPRGWCHAEALGHFDAPNRGLTHWMAIPAAPLAQTKEQQQ